MLHRLVRLWQGFVAWLLQRPPAPEHHHGPFSEPYQASNLHARHSR
jgi:hypothetical protein